MSRLFSSRCLSSPTSSLSSLRPSSQPWHHLIATSSTCTSSTSTPRRAFSGTSPAAAKSTKNTLAELHAGVPVYPYGPAQHYKQSNFGLYGGAQIRVGNAVSADRGVRSRRTWRPNVHRKRLWSEALAAYLPLRLTTAVLRSVDKAGGIDAYLLAGKPARLRELGMEGWRLRWRLMQTELVRQRFREERTKLGLAEDTAPGVGLHGAPVSQAQIERDISVFDEGIRRGDELVIGSLEGEHVETQLSFEERVRQNKQKTIS